MMTDKIIEWLIGILTALYAILVGIARWYFKKQDAKVEQNTKDIQELEKELALNKQNDEKVSESIEKIEKSMESIDDFFKKYGFVIEKMYQKELKEGS